jgi:site-specific DNA-methyltransferase (adenine-specific)
MERFLNKVFQGDARRLLQMLPPSSIDAVITDPMYGVRNQYDWGPDPSQGDPAKHWEYHEPMYRGCLRVLKPGGILAWSASIRFLDYFTEWFGDHQVWTVTRYGRHCSSSGNIWIVQTREQKPVALPSGRVPVIRYEPLGDLKKLHPCQKTVEEMRFMVESLTEPGQIVLDCFCGLGSTLIAAEQLGRRWIGCDLSRRYCQVAMKRLAVGHDTTTREKVT